MFKLYLMEADKLNRDNRLSKRKENIFPLLM